jgi:hypothetical protein
MLNATLGGVFVQGEWRFVLGLVLRDRRRILSGVMTYIETARMANGWGTVEFLGIVTRDDGECWCCVRARRECSPEDNAKTEVTVICAK